MNFANSSNLSLKDKRFTQSGCNGGLEKQKKLSLWQRLIYFSFSTRRVYEFLIFNETL